MLRTLLRASQSPVVVLGLGTGLGQAVTLVASAVLARYFLPEDFGAYALFLAFVSFAGPFLCLRYELALVSCKEDELKNLFSFCLTSTLVVALIASCLLLGFVRADVLGYAVLGSYDALFITSFLFLLFLGSSQTLHYWLLRHQNYSQLACLTLSRSVIRASVQIGAGVLSIAWFGLLWGECAGWIFFFLLAYLFFQKRGGSLQNYYTLSGSRAALQRLKKFPFFSLPASVMHTLASDLPVVLLTMFYGVQFAGFFALVQRCFSAVVYLATASVGDVFYKKFSEHAHSEGEKAKKAFLKTSALLIVFAIPIGVSLWWAGEELFVLIFGENWRLSGQVALLMLPWFIGRLLVRPLLGSVYALGNQEAEFRFDALVLVITLLSIGGSQWLGASSVECVLYWSVGTALSYVIYFLAIARKVMSHSSVDQASD